MRALLIIGGIIVGLVLLVLIVAAFTRKTYAIAAEVVIDRPVAEVYSFVKQLKNQDKYSKWILSNPGTENTYTGVDGTPGFVYAWDGKGNAKAGKGEQELKALKENERVDWQIRFFEPFSGLADCSMTTEPVGQGKTKVRWDFNSAMKYPLNIMISVFNVPKKLQGDMQESLENMKRELEKR